MLHVLNVGTLTHRCHDPKAIVFSAWTIKPDVASQMRVALSNMPRNTGSNSPADPLITLKTLGSRGKPPLRDAGIQGGAGSRKVQVI
jgi:hypothetical protein